MALTAQILEAHLDIFRRTLGSILGGTRRVIPPGYSEKYNENMMGHYTGKGIYRLISYYYYLILLYKLPILLDWVRVHDGKHDI